MAYLSTQEIRQLPEKEFHEELKKALHEQMKTEFDHKNGHSKSSDQLKKNRKYIAQLKTIQVEQTMEKAKAKK